MTRGRCSVSLLVGCLLILASITCVNAQAPTLGGMLEAGLIVREVKSLADSMFGLVHRPLLHFGHEIEFKAIYQPEDGPSCIHMKHDPKEPSDKRRIRLEATVEYKYELEDDLPAPAFRELASLSLPKRGPVEDVRVRFWVPNEILLYTEFRARDWDGLLPTWSKYTDAMGVAAPHLYPITEHPLGGIRKIATAQVRAQAMVQATQGIPHDWLPFGAIMAEEILFPVDTYAAVSVEYHEPTEWEGSVMIFRSVIGSSRLTAPPPEPNAGIRTTLEAHNENGSFAVEIPSVRLSKEGRGTAKYQGKLDMYAQGMSDSQYRIKEKMLETETDETFRGIIEIESEGHTEENGNVPVKIWVSPSREKYVIVVESGCGAQAVQNAVSSGATAITKKWNDSDGEHEETNYYNGMPQLDIMGEFLLPVPAPLIPPTWESFDPDAQVLSGSTTWIDQREARGQTYSVETTLEWNLQRILP